MMSNDKLRSKETSRKYRDHRATGVLERSCPLCDAPEICTFTHWKIISNNFPYDLIAKTHHMIVPRRHTKELELSESEMEEFRTIKYTDLQKYDILVEATKNTKSIPAHFHLHLIDLK